MLTKNKTKPKIAHRYTQAKIARSLTRLAVGDKIAVCYQMSKGRTDKWYAGEIVKVDNQNISIYFEEDDTLESYSKDDNLVYNLMHSAPRVDSNLIDDSSTSQALTFDFCNGRETPLDLPAILTSLKSTSLKEVMDELLNEPLEVRRSTRPKKPKLWN